MRKTLLALTFLSIVTAGCGATPTPGGTQTPSIQGLPSGAQAAASQGNVFPGLGHVVRVDFGNQWDLHFTSLTQMTYTPVGHPIQDGSTVTIAVTEIRPDIYMVTWQEADGTSVVHVEDYGNGALYTNITSPGGQFESLKGTLHVTDLPA